MKKFDKGYLVYIDSDQGDWGRVTGEALILDTTKRRLFVLAHSIKAYIWVNKEDAKVVDRAPLVV
jgi:hypothetical protein